MLGWLGNAARTGRLLPLRAWLAAGARRGVCPICEGNTLFIRGSAWLRDHYYCARCFSIPRFRAVIRALNERLPDWRDREVHESSPAGAASEKIARECRRYVATQYFPDLEPGTLKAGYRCEDLERQTFADAAFDLVVTQDVFEHVVDPARAFAEVARTLRPGGAHVFTVPWYRGKPTVIRAHRDAGRVIHDLPHEYHGNPIDPRGSLVVTEWGDDMLDFIAGASGLATTVESIFDPRQGIEGEFREVFISRKAGPS